jgi:putative intracellular protease/amidase
MRLFFLAALLVLAVNTVRAETFEGHVMPANCRNENPAGHTRSCALACKKTGFGLMTSGGDWIPFDAAGNTKAVAMLEASTQSADLKARVQGRRDKGVLAVDSIVLIAAAAEAGKSAVHPTSVAILLFDGAQTIDYTGPYEVFSDAMWQGDRAFRVFTVAAREGTIRTAAGMVVTPDFTFGAAPHADIVVVPGGAVTPVLEDAATIAWVRKVSADARIVMSVCNGAFFLARAGLLDGLDVTTTAGNLATLQQMAPKAKVTANKRVTDNGKIVTTGGLTAGIDGALHIVQRETSETLARGLALYLEYDWQREGSFLPAALAFRHVMPLAISTLSPLGRDASFSASEGDERSWTIEARIAPPHSAKELSTTIRDTATTLLGWKSLRADEQKGCFGFDDFDGSTWHTCFELGAPVNGAIPVTLRAERQAAPVASK